jgi:hypothetical protein
MRVRVNDVLVSRVAVATAITNGTFAALGSWTQIPEEAAQVIWGGEQAGPTPAAVSNNTGAKLNLTGTGYIAAGRYQLVTVAAPDLNVQHALRIVVERGPVTFRAGSTIGGDEYITEAVLKTGTHSLTLTPTGDFYVQFSSTARALRYVTSIAVEAAGVLQLPTTWLLADLTLMRWDQSGDVVFVNCAGRQQRRIERRSGNSWSVVTYAPDDGPFRIQNIGPTRLKASAVYGDITLTATAPLFKSTHVGGLFRLLSAGQAVTQLLGGADQYSDIVRVNGVTTNSRVMMVAIAGVYSGIITLQRSFDGGLTWATATTYSGVTAGIPFDDSGEDGGGLSNVIVLYRLGFVGSDYVSGSASVSITNSGGGITGIVRVTAFASNISVSASVVKSLGGTTATANWSEGDWSDYRGYPGAVSLYEGRLWHTGKGKIWGSLPDGFESFDDTVVGDSGPINRSIGRGPVDSINWLLPILQLVLGADGSEISARASAQGEVLTPTNFNLKASTTQGSAKVAAVAADNVGFFVQRSGRRLYRLVVNNLLFGIYEAENQSVYVPDLKIAGIVKIAVQRQPDTRIHCILADGTVAVLVFDEAETVSCWLLVSTDGFVEDVTVLPGAIEDQVYYTVKRTLP